MASTLTIVQPDLSLDTKAGRCVQVATIRALVGWKCEGIEILTGFKAGKRLEDGKFEEGSINGRVQKRLEQLAKVMRDFGKEEKKGKAAKDNEAS